MRYWLKRLRLLWQFVRLIPQARQLELDCQKIEQKMHDIAFSNALANNAKEKELAWHQGFVEGIQWAKNRFRMTDTAEGPSHG